MASTYTSLGVELQVTGENAGTWGDKTNTNLTLIQQLVGGFNQTSIAGGAQTTALTVVDGNTTGTAQQNMTGAQRHSRPRTEGLGYLAIWGRYGRIHGAFQNNTRRLWGLMSQLRFPLTPSLLSFLGEVDSSNGVV